MGSQRAWAAGTNQPDPQFPSCSRGTPSASMTSRRWTQEFFRVLGRFAKGVRCERGIGLIETLGAIPLFLAVSTAASVFGLQVMKGQAETQNRAALAANAQRSLDQTVREMRSASKVEWLTPDVSMPVSALEPVLPAVGSGITSIDNDNCLNSGDVFSSMGYCAGETNRVLAKNVSMPSVGSARRDVLYRCDYQAVAFLPIPRCYKIYSVANSGAGLVIENDPIVLGVLSNPSSLPGDKTCSLIYPVGGVSGTQTSGAAKCSVAQNNAVVQGASGNQSVFAANDWAWPSLGLGIFQFKRNGVGAYPSVDQPVDYLEIHPVICLRNSYCNHVGYKRPLRLTAGVTPRNLTRFTSPDECFNQDKADDPPGLC